MACLCAPTTHEGSFRCRFHRAAPSPSAQSASSHQKLGAFPCNPLDISARLQPAAARAESLVSASAATSTAPHPPSCNLPSSPPPLMSSSSSSSSSPASSPSASSSKPPCRTSSSPSPSRYTRLPLAKQHILSPTSPSRSIYPGSSTTSLLSAAAMAGAGTCRSAPSASHAAALAIMKQHLHNSKYNTRGRVSRRDNGMVLLRSSAVCKLGPSRLSRMSRACADDVPLLKNVDRCLATPQPQESSSFYSDGEDEPLPTKLPSMEATQINFNMHSTRAKLKQSDSSCKSFGHKAGPFFLSAVY